MATAPWPDSPARSEVDEDESLSAAMSQAPVGRKRITEFITDRQLRLKSYTRRRHVPFKRLLELDATCATASLLVQFCPDFDELLYLGHPMLVDGFLAEAGLTLAQVPTWLAQLRLEPDREPSIPASPVSSIRVSGRSVPSDPDGDYSPTPSGRASLEKHRRKERTSELATSATDSRKSLRSRKESLMAKIKETDNVCDCRSFLLILSPDRDASFFYGHPDFVSLFFGRGLSRSQFESRVNVRRFEVDELDYNVCSVPHCLVSRHTLSRWRLAAQELYHFPPIQPLNLHICPDAERNRWMAELDLDPDNTNGKIAVCSLHFRDGFPSDRYPGPSLFLRPDQASPGFFGDSPSDVKPPKLEDHRSPSPIDFTPHYTRLCLKRRKNRPTTPKWRVPPATPFSLYLHRRNKSHPVRLATKLVRRAQWNRLGSWIRRKPTGGTVFSTTKSFVDAVRKKLLAVNQLNPMTKLASITDEMDGVNVKEDWDEAPLDLSDAEMNRFIQHLYPRSEAVTMNTRKKYVCSVCHSVCDLFGLFLHMKQVHKGLLCQYCLKLFKRVPDLENHLKNVHQLQPLFFHSTQEFAKICGANYSFICGSCSQVVTSNQLATHPCNKSKKRSYDCPFCQRAFSFQNQLEMHMCNGWCKGMPWLGQPSRRDTMGMYKMLTGLELDKTFQSSAKRIKTKEEEPKKPLTFHVSDRQIMAKFSRKDAVTTSLTGGQTAVVLIEGLPESGTIYHGMTSRAVNSHVKKEIKDSGFTFNLIEKLTDLKIKPSRELRDLKITRAGKNFIIEGGKVNLKTEGLKISPIESSASPQPESNLKSIVPPLRLSVRRPSFKPPVDDGTKKESLERQNQAIEPIKIRPEDQSKVSKPSAELKKETKTERINRVATEIQSNWEKIRLVMDTFKKSCLFCEQAQFISMDTVFMLSHLIIIHDRTHIEKVFEENPELCIARVKKQVRDCRIREIIFNYDLEEDFQNLAYRCTYCSNHDFLTYDDLLAHVGASHNSKMLACHLCTDVFMNYGSYLSHICGGPPHGHQQAPKTKFNCRFCFKPDMNNFLDFQFHLRKAHVVCEICMKNEDDQAALLEHCLTHAQELMCTKCFLTYDTLLEFRKHLYLKHEPEHKVCKACHQKTWPHVYHFCVKPTNSWICEVCELELDNFKSYRVHLRSHTGAKPYLCSVPDCSKSYISRQLLWKHQIRRHQQDLGPAAAKALQEKRQKRVLGRYGAKSKDTLEICQRVLLDLVCDILPSSKGNAENDMPADGEAVGSEASNPQAREDKENMDMSDQNTPVTANDNSTPEPPRDKEYDAIDAAVRSIIGPEGSFDLRKSPMKSPTPNHHDGGSLRSPAHGLGGSQAPLLVRTNANAPPVLIKAHQIQSTIDPSAVAQAGNIPIVRVGQVMPTPTGPTSMPGLVPRHPKANVRLPTIRPQLLFPAEPPSAKSEENEILPPNAKILDSSAGAPASDQESSDLDNSQSPTKAAQQPVVSGIWNQDLMFIGDSGASSSKSDKRIKTLNPTLTKSWDVVLSESSDEGGQEKPRKPRIVERTFDVRVSLKDHDYCQDVYNMVTQSLEDLSEMDKLLSQVAMGSNPLSVEKDKKHKKKKKKRKKNKKNKKKGRSSENRSSSSSDSETESTDVTTRPLSNGLPPKLAQAIGSQRRGSGPKPVYHTPGASTGVTAGAARPHFTSSSEDEGGEDSDDTQSGRLVGSSDEEPNSSDLDTDFEADDLLENMKQIQQKGRRPKPSSKVLKATTPTAPVESNLPKTPSLKLKIKLPPKPPSPSKVGTPISVGPPSKPRARMINTSLNRKHKVAQARVVIETKPSKPVKRKRTSFGTTLHGQPMSKKMRESLALNQASSSSSASEDSDDEEEEEEAPTSEPSASLPPSVVSEHPRSGHAPMMTDEKLYCVCQSPHDDVSEMIGCDAPDCRLEWFHFECVGILVPPEGQWYCPECTTRYKIRT